MNYKIAFIGGGNMASSLIGGLLANDYSAELITVAEPDNEKLAQLNQQFNIKTTTDNNSAVTSSDVVILCVKPQMLQQVCIDIGFATQARKPLIISIAAGILSTDIDRWLGNNCALVRCMPNTPSLIQLGATGLFANTSVSKAQRNIAEKILSATGITLWVENENILHAATHVAGSGPAYFFLLREAMQKAGETLGLDASTARQLTLQTALGAAQMAINSSDSPAHLREKVTSRGGTTEAAINYFQNNNFEQTVLEALTKARDQAIKMANTLGKDQ